MKLVLYADDSLADEFIARPLPSDVSLERVETTALFSKYPDADLFINLASLGNSVDDYQDLGSQPILVNAVNSTFSQFPKPDQIVRLNAWPGMLRRPVLEMVALNKQIQIKTSNILDALNWPYRFVPDLPGMISARIIAMIINEAFFAVGEGVSSRDEIDTAMKTGTNYPWGPFEWTKKIGAHRVVELLQAMNERNQRYSISPALQEEARRPK